MIKKLSKSCIDDYTKCITDKNKGLIIMTGTVKINDEDIKPLTFKNYSLNLLTTYNYKISQLRAFAKQLKLKLDGTKKELTTRIYMCFYQSSYVIKIQKTARGIFQRTYNKLHGPAYKNRKLCTNDMDFITMETFDNVNFHQFYSYKDDDGFVYGFEICSIYNLFFKCGSNLESFKNPYNRNIFPSSIIKSILRIVSLESIIKSHIQLEIEDDTLKIEPSKVIALRALGLFQNIDALGNYSDANWFLSLSRGQIVKMMRELTDIFTYRAQLTPETKRNICPPHGNPFLDVNMNYINNETDINNIRKVVLTILERFVNSGINTDSKSLGAYYVLASLTLVNESAANALPWLYQSVTYNI